MRRFSTALLLLALIGGFPAASGAASDPVSAQAGSWVIGPVAGGKLCSMKNAFQSGQRLVFARDAQGVNSLAVDFGAAALEPGRQYPVTLDLPPLVTRDITAVAGTRQVLLVGLGRDKEFYSALGRAKGLYLTALNREYGYGLAGAADGLQELSACAAALGKTAAAATPPPRKETAARETAALQKTAAADARRAQSAEAESARLKARLAAAEAARGKAAALEAENERLRAVKKAAALEGARLKAEAVTAAVAKEKAAALQAENDRLRGELSAARQKIDAGRAAEGSLAARAKAAEAERARLAADVAAAATAREKSALLQAENERLRQALSLAQQGFEEQRAVAEKTAASPAPVSGASRDRLADILGASGVVPDGGVRAVDSGNAKVFRWTSGDILGSAEESGVDGGEDFGGRVSAWLDRMAGRCRGDFAHTESAPQTQGRFTVQKAEIACIDGANDAAAAIVFIGDGATFSAVMHEGATGSIEAALAQRNAVASAAAVQAELN